MGGLGEGGLVMEAGMPPPPLPISTTPAPSGYPTPLAPPPRTCNSPSKNNEGQGQGSKSIILGPPRVSLDPRTALLEQGVLGQHKWLLHRRLRIHSEWVPLHKGGGLS